MKMFGKGKKIVSEAYKERLLAEIAHYDKRIEEALTKRKNNSFVNESSDVELDEVNPYKLKNHQSWFNLKQQEASLSNRASMTLELAMLTIMQSEVNVMVTPPEVRRPIQEDGTWLEVVAECKIDLVSFAINFYAHKPYRRFAPTRYRNLVVALVKPAHQRELAQSVLPKLNRPHLALQVLQNYASAFRSRRTTLLELAEKYADQLSMEAMPEGGYRVRFLDLLQVEWTLENMWSPIVPFCHRMKFEVEYMPKEYIHAIGKLYKQFKDPSLETSERTHVLSEIFDTCLQARGLAREMQESLESDPETAGRLHERRTTIDQEPDVPNVEHSPKKPKGKENKAQNRKTNMAPPKSIPKKAKKVDANKAAERKGVKRGTEDDAGNDAKKSRTNVDNSKGKAGLKGGKGGIDGKDGETEVVASKTNVQKGDTSKAAAGNARGVVSSTNNGERNESGKVVSNAKEIDEVGRNKVAAANGEKKNGEGKGVKSKSVSDNSEGGNAKNGSRKRDAGNIAVSTEDKDTERSGVCSGKKSKKGDDQNNDENIGNLRDTNTENCPEKVANAKKYAKKVANAKKDEGSKHGTKNSEDGKSVATSKDKNIVVNVANSKKRTAKGESQNIASSKNKVLESNSTNTKRVKDTETTNSNAVASKHDNAKNKTVSKNLKSKEDGVAIKVSKNVVKEANVGKPDELTDKLKEHTAKKVVAKDGNAAKPKGVVKNIANKKNYNCEIAQNNGDQVKKLKETGKVVEKGKDVKEKPTESDVKTNKDRNKETAQVPTEKKKIINPKSTEQKSEQVNMKNNAISDKTTKVSDTQKTVKNYKLLVKKSTVTQSNSIDSNIKNSDRRKKTKDETKNIAPENPTRNILQEKKNRETTQKIVKDKCATNNEKTKADNQNTNLFNVTVTKAKSIPTLKTQDNQMKMADKLKTKIPMMKNKMTFLSLRDKLLVNTATIGKGWEKPVGQKSLPVFKKVVKSLPTRISPRKLPSFKPSSHGYSSK